MKLYVQMVAIAAAATIDHYIGFPYGMFIGRSGVSNSLTAVQVTEMVEYTPSGVDFSVVGGEAPAGDLF